MRRKAVIVIFMLALSASIFIIHASTRQEKIEGLGLGEVRIDDGFWSARQEINRAVTIPHILKELEEVKTVDNFRVAAGLRQGTHFGYFYNDSDLYKWLEAASYSLHDHPDPALKAQVDEIIGIIAKAQQADGYLNTYYTINFPERRWRNLVLNHELYCSGHLMEAAVANNQATGDTALLTVAEKLADHIYGVFGPDKKQGVPGHEEIELALIKLFHARGDSRYLDLASYFIYERGNLSPYAGRLIKGLAEDAQLNRIVKKHRAAYITKEEREAHRQENTEFVTQNKISPITYLRVQATFASGRYDQEHKPVTAQDEAVGHSVRAMYLYSGMADLYMENRDENLISALDKIWQNVTERRMYITGGVGALPLIEGFGRDYELPHRAYTETCAAIGFMLWNHRMWRISGDARFADLFERILYNGFLSGVSLSGDRFFYQNPLVSAGQDQRRPWYPTACCPPNIARTIASLGKYIYGRSRDGLWIFQYIGSSAQIKIKDTAVKVSMQSGLPWEGRVVMEFEPEKPVEFSLHLRIPGWCEGAAITINGKRWSDSLAQGTYQAITRTWEPGDKLELALSMEIKQVRAPEQVKEDRGRAAIMRGPLVYCLEDAENKGLDINGVQINQTVNLSAKFEPDLLSGVVAIKGKSDQGKEFTAIPYYSWANHGQTTMEVWIRQAQRQ